MRRIVLAAFAVTVLAACQPADTELTEEQKAEIAAEVNALHTESLNAWEHADVHRGMSVMLDSPDFRFAGDGQLINGFATAHDIWHSAFTNIEDQTFRSIESHTTVLASNVVHVVEHGTWIEHYTSGEDGPETTFVVSMIWVRDNGEWKVHFGHQSTPNTETP